LFKAHSINYLNNSRLIDDIIKNTQKKLHKSLLFYLGLTLSLRHSVTNSEEDYILSPIADRDGCFYDSRQASPEEPKDADANGAYHIALKGLWNIQQIKQHDWSVEKPAKLNLAISNAQWFSFIQQRLFET
jgi:CRISPR-associated protein Cpf1